MENNLLKTLRKAYNQQDLESIKKQAQENIHYEIWATGEYYIYLKGKINFNDLSNFFKKYNYDIISESDDDHIYIKSKNSEDYISTEFHATGNEYKEYLRYFEEDSKAGSDNDDWIQELENMKKFDSYHMIKAYNETGSKFIVLLALYILKQTGDVLVNDTFNGICLNPDRLQALQELIILQ